MRKRKSKTALVVVKSRKVSKNIVARLGSTGYEAVVHPDPASAVEAATSGRFDLCLLEMGKGKRTGTELAFDLRRAGFRSPIVGFMPVGGGPGLGQLVVWSAGAKKKAEIERLMKLLREKPGKAEA